MLCCYGDKVDGFTQTFTKRNKSLIYFQGEVFFLLTRPLMGDPFFETIRQLMAPTETNKKKIGFTVKEKQATYGSQGTKHKRKIS